MILNRISPAAFESAVSSPVEEGPTLRLAPPKKPRTNPDNNKKLKRLSAEPKEGNWGWLKRVQKDLGNPGLLLLGGTSTADFHIRVAQSQLRYDLSPSYWSAVGIVVDADTFLTVPLQWHGDLDEMPHANGIQKFSIDYLDDVKRYPNIAFIQFSSKMEFIVEQAEAMVWQRSVVDLPELVIRWLEYVWGIQNVVNPLTISKGIPSAVFAEITYGIAGIELTPGLASASSCPEAIWQAAKWWHKFYKATVQASTKAPSMVPEGRFLIRQPDATIAKSRR